MSIRDCSGSNAGADTGSRVDSNRCCVCGRQFTDRQLSGDTLMGEVWAQKGLQCAACGLRYCWSCMPTVGSTKTCRCGSTKIRL
ncbi:MAG: hypothetical protein ACLQPD_18975 [Desulfomonilaceae bacterium]